MSFHEGPIRASMIAYYDAISSGNIQFLASVVDDDFIDRTPLSPNAATRNDLLNAVRSWSEGFPDLRISIDILIVASDSNWAAASTTTEGTHEGTWLGIPASGKSVVVRSIEMLRWESGRIVERSGLIDGLSALQQIGVLPSPGPGE